LLIPAHLSAKQCLILKEKAEISESYKKFRKPPNSLPYTRFCWSGPKTAVKRTHCFL